MQHAYMTLPKNAFVDGVSNNKVFVVQKDNTVKLTKVVGGRIFGDKIEIISGLNEGDRVVTSGRSTLLTVLKFQLLSKQAVAKTKIKRREISRNIHKTTNHGYCIVYNTNPGGILGYSSMGYELIPKFEINVVSVSTIYPGASPAEVETTVTKN